MQKKMISRAIIAKLCRNIGKVTIQGWQFQGRTQSLVVSWDSTWVWLAVTLPGLELVFCQFLLLFSLLYELKNMIVQAHMQQHAFQLWLLILSADPIIPLHHICKWLTDNVNFLTNDGNTRASFCYQHLWHQIMVFNQRRQLMLG